ncbi:MAG: hypothetical protein ACYDHH_20030 [Solirubrobacteraceae bacterium]
MIAGTPVGWGFDATTSKFHFSYTTARPDQAGGAFAPGSQTEIATPALVYPHGYAAHVDGGAIASPPAAAVLRIAACAGARTITVTITPTGSGSASCRVSHHHHRHRRRRPRRHVR